MYYDPDTVYGESTRPVVATARTNEFGDTIFYNAGSGGHCVVINGSLYGESMAPRVHAELIERNAKALYDACITALPYIADKDAADKLASIVAKARG